MDIIDPKNEIFKFRLYRDSCIRLGKVYLKDLRVIANREPGNLIILDNSLYSFANHLSHGILINSFYEDYEDRELVHIGNYLTGFVASSDDVRKVNEQIFKFETLI